MQRFFDIVFSSIALLVVLPLFIILIILLRFTGEGEIFFMQDRIGQNGVIFKLFKFATMLKDSPQTGTGTVTLKNDPRILPLGKFLRKTKLNELPQLINILIGNMSVVGPRPQTRRCFLAFPKATQDTIIQVRPGLSGIGSIVFRDEEEILSDNTMSIGFYDNIIAPYKGDLEIWYVAHQGINTYFKIIFLTIWVIIFPSSGVVWKAFADLPPPPEVLRKILNYDRYVC